MNTKFLLSISALVILTMSAVQAMTTTNNADIQDEHNEISTEFGRTGNINSYQPNESLIVIDGTSYSLDGKGNLTDEDLISGQQIYFNVEKSTETPISHITKIWIKRGPENE